MRGFAIICRQCSSDQCAVSISTSRTMDDSGVSVSCLVCGEAVKL